MKRKIVVKRGETQAIARILGCTYEYVSHSLSFHKDSLLANKIRKVALERGGVYVEFPDVAKQAI